MEMVSCGSCFWIVKFLDGTGHASILHMATVSFAPARKLALVDGVFSPCASHIVHPDQAGTCAQKARAVANWTFIFFYVGLTILQQEFMVLKLLLMKCLCSPALNRVFTASKWSLQFCLF